MIRQEKAAAFESNRIRWEEEAYENGRMPDDAVLPVYPEQESYSRNRQAPQVFLIEEDQKPAVKLYLQAVATLDMLVKDLDSDFALRRYNQKDFAAHIMLTEQITLPWLFGLFSSAPLFDDYTMVQPLCSNQLG
jgi:hypothetical protein